MNLLSEHDYRKKPASALPCNQCSPWDLPLMKATAGRHPLTAARQRNDTSTLTHWGH